MCLGPAEMPLAWRSSLNEALDIISPSPTASTRLPTMTTTISACRNRKSHVQYIHLPSSSPCTPHLTPSHPISPIYQMQPKSPSRAPHLAPRPGRRRSTPASRCEFGPRAPDRRHLPPPGAPLRPPTLRGCGSLAPPPDRVWQVYISGGHRTTPRRVAVIASSCPARRVAAVHVLLAMAGSAKRHAQEGVDFSQFKIAPRALYRHPRAPPCTLVHQPRLSTQ